MYLMPYRDMPWAVIFEPEFDAEIQALDEDLQDELLAHATLLQAIRSHVRATDCRYPQGVAVREHEGATLRLEGRGMACRLRIRPRA